MAGSHLRFLHVTQLASNFCLKVMSAEVKAQFLFNFITSIVCACVRLHAHVHTCHDIHVEIKGQPGAFGFSPSIGKVGLRH